LLYAEEYLTDWSDVHVELNAVRGSIPESYDDMAVQTHPDDSDGMRHAYLVSDKRRCGFDIEYGIIETPGETRWIREYAEVEFDEYGAAIAHVGFDQNITEIEHSWKFCIALVVNSNKS
jgi:hypothetical protein